MQKCDHPVIAMQIHPKTLSMITALNGGVTPLIEEDTTYFMMYCVGSDHEDVEIIAKDTYDRTYEQMPDSILVMQVNTID